MVRWPIAFHAPAWLSVFSNVTWILFSKQPYNNPLDLSCECARLFHDTLVSCEKCILKPRALDLDISSSGSHLYFLIFIKYYIHGYNFVLGVDTGHQRSQILNNSPAYPKCWRSFWLELSEIVVDSCCFSLAHNGNVSLH